MTHEVEAYEKQETCTITASRSLLFFFLGGRGLRQTWAHSLSMSHSKLLVQVRHIAWLCSCDLPEREPLVTKL